MGSLRYLFSCQGSGRPYSRELLNQNRVKDNTCIVLDGADVVFASEAERFTKIKHDSSNPVFALQAYKNFGICGRERRIFKMEDRICEMSHHDNHIYEAFYQSGFKEAAVLVNDGHGTVDDCITLAYMQEGKRPLILKKFPRERSVCGLYATASSRVHGHRHSEGKFMGLAGYGKNNGRTYAKWDEKKHCVHTFLNDMKADIKECMRDENDVMLAKDVAFTLQQNFEDVMVHVAIHLKRLLNEQGIETKNLCLSGGGILNCPANSRIVELGLFQNYYASPQPSDGCAESIGRCFQLLELQGACLKSKRLQNAYLGVAYPREELQLQQLENSTQKLVGCLANGCVVAWYQGGAEYGPRALGHRSFLADPTKKEMLDALNKIKGRENWRPLAPIVPERLFKLVFDVENTDMCEFMLRTLTVKEEWQARLQTVCHVDGTTRPQLLKREVNPQLYDLLMTYFEQTGTPCLVNTSLNINGFPIVETPTDFSNLVEELHFLDDIPDVKAIFVDDEGIFELQNSLEGANEIRF